MKIELSYNNSSILDNYFILEYKLLLFFTHVSITRYENL